MSVFLLDVNVLLALAWPNHQFNRTARRRFASSRDRWATCAITQLGFVRLSSNPSAVRPAKTPFEAARLLAHTIQDSLHTYLDVMPPPVDPATHRFDKILGAGQVTDAYLLQVARSYGATFVTFDKRLRAIGSSDQTIEILGL